MGMILITCHWWIVALWVAFIVYWALAASSARRGLKRSAFRRTSKLHLVLSVVIVIAVFLSRRSSALHQFQQEVFWSVPMAMTGALVATAGAAVAFSARAVIGRNWGMPAMRRTDTDLVTSGPYAFVRHPIYSGILLLMIGTAIGLLPTWWLVVAAAGTYFFISARAEEKYMTDRFPESYPAYRSRTKMLVPFLL